MIAGVDFGTTRIVVAAVDRGNYPVVTFTTPDGGVEEWFPPLIAVRGVERRFGWDAHALQADPDWTVLRSLKRVLEAAGPNTLVQAGDTTAPLLQLLTGLFSALRHALADHSSLNIKSADALQVMLGVPANANSNQRFLTSEAFRLAGFSILGILNEPSAASVEFGHRNKSAATEPQRLLVYDLGGGTFDVSLVEHDERTHTVLSSEGIATLGGDDFDHELASMALHQAGLDWDALTQGEHFRLLEEARRKKETVHPNTRKITIDLGAVRDGWDEVSVPAAEYFERARPLVDETMNIVRDLLAHNGNPDIDALYVTGGGSELPLVARVLRDFGRRVKRSAYTRSATAIGLAIQADASAGYQLRDRFTRYFGVWREAECGTRIIFDPLFPKSTPLPAAGEDPLRIVRTYRPVHNIGHFRYLECSHLHHDGQPSGDITIWDEIQFPFDPALRDAEDLAASPVSPCDAAPSQEIEEIYECTAGGNVAVRIRNASAGYERSYALGRWAVKSEPVTPVRKRRAPRKTS